MKNRILLLLLTVLIFNGLDASAAIFRPIPLPAHVLTPVKRLLPTATITGNATVCLNATEPVITFTGAGGTAPYTFTYNVNGGADQTITTVTGDSVTLPVPTTATGAFVYNLVSVSYGSPAVSQNQTGTATVNVVVLTAAISGNTTICPGYSATLPVTGSPGATVVISSSTGQYFNVTLSAAGTASFTTPALNNTTTFSLVTVSSNPPGCVMNVTGSAVVTVNQNGCASVAAGDLNLSPTIAPICTVGECRDLTAIYQNLGSTTSYTVSPIPYCPQESFTPVGATPVSVNIDDVWSGDINLPFAFCFFGQSHNTANVGSNGVISFDNFNAGDYCNWPFTQTIPNTTFPIRNAIYGVYQDINPATAPPPPTQVNINYKLVGVAPCRKLIVNFANVPQFSCGNSVGLQTSQVVLYEVSNIIEVYVQNRTPCNSWNSGSGLIGIQNAAGTVGYTPPGRNTGPWTATNEAWRFTPSGTSAVTFSWSQGGTFVSSNPTISVCPTTTTTYTAQAIYDSCGLITTVTKDVTVEVIDDLTQTPQDITQCTNTFDLTQNTPVILGGLNPGDYDISYHLTAADAQNILNPISNPDAFISSGQTIYAAIQNFNAGCINVKSFDLIIQCGPEPVQPPDLTVCDDPSNDGIAPFDFTPQTPIALGSFSASDYVITYHLTQADADNDVNAISPITNFMGTDGQTIYIRMEDVSNSTLYGTTSFQLFINPVPTASISGTTTICSGGTAMVTFTGTPGA
ncbi:MAG: hypothetical protein EOO51_02755, partial [Flavobacterium sp.]